jgi:uncharacterized low-complexity protein
MRRKIVPALNSSGILKLWRFYLMAIKSKIINPVAAVVGVAFVSSLAFSSIALADDNPFSTEDLDAGYQLAGDKDKEGSCGEGKCGGDKGGEGSCGEKGHEGSCGEKGHEGSCGEKGGEGSCGEKGGEGSCGEKGEEGSCGGSA